MLRSLPKKRPKSQLHANHRIALVLPCLNEEETIAKVIRDFRRELPQMDVYVFDNGSTDRSREIAIEEGAQLVRVPNRGKGQVVRRMFEEVDADILVMVDSDDTYDATGLHRLIQPVADGEADMVVGSRLRNHSPGAFRTFHKSGNDLIVLLINTIFGSHLTDILSGYRVMSRRFVKNIPLLRDGFEVETELTVYSLICGFVIKEIPLPYGDRPAGSVSKLNTFQDGYKVLLTIVWLARDLKPLLFFGFCSVICLGAVTFPTSRLVEPFQFWQMIGLVFSAGFFVTGLVLNTLNVKASELQFLYRRQKQNKEELANERKSLRSNG